MELVNRLPLPAAAFRQFDRDGGFDCVVSVRGTFMHVQDGPLKLADTQESFLCIEGEWEMTTGFDHEFVTTVKPYDLVPVPTKVMRGFRNTGPERSRLFVIIQGAEKMMDMVAFPKRVGAEMERRFGPKVVDEFAKIHLIFDAEDRVEAA